MRHHFPPISLISRFFRCHARHYAMPLASAYAMPISPTARLRRDAGFRERTPPFADAFIFSFHAAAHARCHAPSPR
jgi:hypothetical protein